MGGLSTLGRSSLGGSIRALANQQRAIRAGEKAEAIRLEGVKRQGAADERAERGMRVQEGRLEIQQKEADAKYNELYVVPRSLSMLTNKARHPKVKQRMKDTMSKYMKTENTTNLYNMDAWFKEHKDVIPEWKKEDWSDTRGKLNYALTNLSSTDGDVKKEVDGILGSHGWVLKRPLKKHADVEEAIQAADDQLLRIDPVVEKSKRAREAAVEKAKIEEAKAKEAEGKTKKLTQAQLIDDTRGHYNLLMKIMIDPDTGVLREGQEEAYNNLLTRMSADLRAIGQGKEPSWLKTQNYTTKDDLKKGYDSGELTWDEVDRIMKERGWSK